MELYNKYRPQTLEEIRGNELAMKSIKSEIDNGSHVFLLTGPGGTGKTTTARVFAKILGATDISIRELNSSDNRGIDTVREIMEQVRYAPLEGKVVYILDEMHQQTSSAQNALLKVLEECPEYCYFFLCTTDPQKLIQPLLTRCSRIEMKPLNNDEMLKLLRIVAHKEQKVVNIDILKQIASLSNGSSRMALKILGSVLFMETDEERKAYLEKNTFSDDNPQAIELCRALINQEGWAKYMECMTNLKEELETSAEGIRHMVMSYAISVLKKKMNPVAVAMLQAFSNADTFKNKGKAIYVAILDMMDMLG